MKFELKAAKAEAEEGRYIRSLGDGECVSNRAAGARAAAAMPQQLSADADAESATRPAASEAAAPLALPEDMDACFRAFDKDGDGKLSLAEFGLICAALFRNEEGLVYDVDGEKLQEMFQVFDSNADGFIDKDEFTFCWNNWIKVVVRPVSALLVVDVQNDFISGSLNISRCSARQDGAEVVEPINRMTALEGWACVAYSLDWHPADHVSFIDNVHLRELHASTPVAAERARVYDTVVFAGAEGEGGTTTQRLWPRHCVQESWGAQLHAQLAVAADALKVYKGTDPDVDSYSVFRDNQRRAETSLHAALAARSVTDLYVCGLALDVCVAATAADALALGYRTVLVDDACRGVDLRDMAAARAQLQSRHALVVSADRVPLMLAAADRRPELAYKLALDLRARLHPQT